MADQMDLTGWKIEPESLSVHGSGLTRPECVAATRSGRTYVSHFGGGVTVIEPDGACRDILGTGEPLIATNGFALMPDESFLCANLMPPGGVWRVTRDGLQEPFLTEIEGRPLPPCNFVHHDLVGRTWITVSTWIEPRALAYRPDTADGVVILVDKAGARIVADGLGYTNEAIPDPSCQWLVVNETFARRTTRFRIGVDGTLGEREVVAEYGPGTFPDGLAFDEAGGLWVTSVVSNRLIRIAPNGEQQILLEDSDPDWLDEVERAFQAGEMGRPHMDQARSRVIKHLSSLAFGGPDRRTIYLGNLLDDCIYSVPSPVAGSEPAHWDYGD